MPVQVQGEVLSIRKVGAYNAMTVVAPGMAELTRPGHSDILDLYRKLIALRRSRPDLSNPWLDKVDVWHGDQYVVMRRGQCAVAANLARVPQTVSLRAAPTKVLLATEPGVVLQRDRVDLPPETAVVAAFR